LAVADDSRKGEVSPLHSSYEVGEQRRSTACGVDGANGVDPVERGKEPHVPDTEPGKRVPGPRPCAAGSEAKEEGAVHGSTSPCYVVDFSGRPISC
jgi:hypothetical protein